MTGCEDGVGCSRYLELINASSPHGNSVQKSSSYQHEGLPEVWPHGSVPRAWLRPPSLNGAAKATPKQRRARYLGEGTLPLKRKLIFTRLQLMMCDPRSVLALDLVEQHRLIRLRFHGGVFCSPGRDLAIKAMKQTATRTQ